jgi:exopolysaccharide biosynthesis protein
MTDFRQLTEPHFYKYKRYLPTAFDESLSLLQKVNKIIKTLQDVIGSQNDLIDYLNDFSAKFDENLYTTIEDVLTKWLEDGQLFNLIDVAYGGMKQDFEQSFHYDEITTQTYLGTPGVYYVTTIPTVDKKGNPILLEKGYANDVYNGGLETARSFATRHHSSIVSNASIFNTTSGVPIGVHIKDGVVHKNTNDSTGWTLGYKKDTQELLVYPANVDGNTLLSYGITDTWSAFYPIIQDHQNVNSDVWGITTNSTDPNPREVIAQMDDKTILLFTFRGREDDHVGYTYTDMQTELQKFNVKLAYNLDGGGSTQLVKDNILINVPIDGNYSDERKVMDFISVKKTTSKSYEDIYNVLGEMSAIVRKLDARHISKYGDEIPGRLTFKDFMYLALDKAIYGTTESGVVKRLLGLYTDSSVDIDGRAYLGNIDIPLSIQSSNNIIVTLGNNVESYRVNLTQTNAWIDAPLTSGLTHMASRNLQYKKMNAFETRIRGAVVVGTTYGVANQLLFTLPIDCAPTQTLVVPVSTLSGGRESNDVIINTDGTVLLRFAVTAPTSTTAIQIQCTINKET